MNAIMTRPPQPSTRPIADPPRTIRIAGYVLAMWYLGFAALNAWHLIRPVGVPGGEAFAGHRAGLVAMSVVVLLLKLVGAVVAVGSVRPRWQGSWLLAAATWGAASVLVLYSIGNLVITFGTVFGLMAPSAAWTAAGGITPRSVAYVLFFAIGAVLAVMLAVSLQRRHQPDWTALAAGVIAAPALLGGLLVVAPTLLTAAGLLPE